MLWCMGEVCLEAFEYSVNSAGVFEVCGGGVEARAKKEQSRGVGSADERMGEREEIAGSFAYPSFSTKAM